MNTYMMSKKMSWLCLKLMLVLFVLFAGGVDLSPVSLAEQTEDVYFDNYGNFSKENWKQLALGIWRNKDTGASVVFTEPYSQGIIGYSDIIPLLVYLDDEDNITEIEVLPNSETPSYMRRIERRGLIKNYIGVSVRDVLGLSVDVVSGATMSSNAISNSIISGLQTYIKVTAL